MFNGVITHGYNLRRLPHRLYYNTITNTVKDAKKSLKYGISKRKTTNMEKNTKRHTNQNKCVSSNPNPTCEWNIFNTYVNPNGQIDISNNEKDNWVSATSVKNYLLGEPLLDWLGLYYNKIGYNDKNTNIKQHPNCIQPRQQLTDIIIKEREHSHLNIFFEKGNDFEKNIIDYLKTKYPDDVKTVATNKLSEKMSTITLKYMHDGIPIIEQAVLYNYKNKTFGVADILIRSDWINKIFEMPMLSSDEEHIPSPNLKTNYHYRVIDIKWTTMDLCANGHTIRNNCKFPAYKGQLAIYNASLGIMQGYTPSIAYILAKSWNENNKNNMNGITKGHNPFTRLGSIDFNSFDKKYIAKTFNAINWVRNVRYNGGNWSCLPPSIPELYPNMCNQYDTPYHNIKLTLANKTKELTQMWNVGLKNRLIAHKKGIYSWNDKKCSSSIMGINGKKIGPIIDKIIKINRDSAKLIEPTIITNNMCNWQQQKALDFYIDFEYVSECFYSNRDGVTDMKANNEIDNRLIFLIGVGYLENDIWKYKCFLANAISFEEEYKILNEFATFINNIVDANNNMNGGNEHARFLHWSHAEKTLLKMACNRHGDFEMWQNSLTWIDMCKVFVDEPIVLKGAHRFSLKDVAKTMGKHNMISSNWNTDGPSNGLDAMLNAIKYYKFMINPNDAEHDYYEKIMQSIVYYNEIDCKVLYEIVLYLRKKHCSI